MNFRTDLAIELAQQLQDTVSQDYQTVQKEEDGAVVFHTKILTPAGERQFGKPAGDYITVEVVPFSDSVTDSAREAEVIARQIKSLLPGQDGLVLVVGLGNLSITPDALGPKVIDGILATRHLAGEWEKAAQKDQLRPVAAIAPGVLGLTGIETSEILESLAAKIRPDVLIAIDALAARESDRLNKTIQLADTGITPGSGVGNHRQAINEQSIGIPVLAIGVPTVIAVPTIVNDAMDVLVDAIGKQSAKNVLKKFNEEERYQLACEMVTPYLEDMFVTPKDIDEAVKRISYTISEAINQAVFAAG